MSVSTVTLVPNAVFARVVTLYKGGAVFDMAGSICKARVVEHDRTDPLSSEVSISSSFMGADWSVSKVAIVLPAVSTSAITQQGAARVEIQVTQNGIDDHWWFYVDLATGHTT